jgi:uncharacterized ferredoxin-like protein
MYREYVGTKTMLKLFDELVADGADERDAFVLASRNRVEYEDEKAAMEDGIPDATPLTHEMVKDLFNLDA